MKLSLKATGYLIVNNERTNGTFQYEVPELVNEQTGVYVQQIRDYWVIIRVIKPGILHEISSGHYFTAEDALSVLQEEQDEKVKTA